MRTARFLGMLGLLCLSHIAHSQLIADFCFCDPADILNNTAGDDGIAASPSTQSNGEGIYNNAPDESLDVAIPASIFRGAENLTLEFDFYNQKNVSFLINAGGAEEAANDVPNGDPFRIGNKADDNGNNGKVGLLVVYYTTADPQNPISSGFISNSAVARGERANILFIYDKERGVAQLFKNGNLVWETPANQRTPGEAFYLETKTTDSGQGYLTVGYNMNQGAPDTPWLYRFRAYNGICRIVTPPSADEVSRCGEGPVTLQAEAPGVANGNFRWYANPSGAPIAGAVNSTFAPMLTQSTTYYVSVLEGPCESERVPVLARVIPYPPPPNVANQQRCEPGVFTLQAESAAGNTYRWYAADGTTLLARTDPEANPNDVLSSQGTYTTDVLTETTDFYVAAVTEGCEGEPARVTAIVRTPPSPPAADEVTLCEPGTAILSVNNPSDFAYRWYDQPTGGTLLEENNSGTWETQVVSDTDFYVSAWDGACESECTPVPVTIFTADDLDAGPNVRIIPDDSIPLQATIGYDRYEWYPGEGLSNTEVSNPVASPAQTTTYWVTVTTASGCEATDRVTVEVVDYPVPNAFTPNDDGLNDQWELTFLERYPGCKVTIYNRWGEMVYYSEGYQHPWDGRYAGQGVVLGTYTYVIDLGNGKKPVRGNLVVLK